MAAHFLAANDLRLYCNFGIRLAFPVSSTFPTSPYLELDAPAALLRNAWSLAFAFRGTLVPGPWFTRP
jgi:hypothetical protein